MRRPPRGVRKDRYAADNWYDVWLPNLAPSAALVSRAQAAANGRAWASFVRRYRAEMARPENVHIIESLAALSHGADFSVGCYCEDEARCDRGVLRQILESHGAKLAD